MDNNTVTITIDRFEKLVRDSQKLAVLTQIIENNMLYNAEIKAVATALKEGDKNA